MRKQELLEMEALTAVGLPCLPKEYEEGDGVWVRAVAKIKTNDFNDAYAIVENNYGHKPVLARLFGKSFGKFVSIHPFEFLNNDRVPSFNNIGEKKGYLVRRLKVPMAKVASLKNEELDLVIFNLLIKDQLIDKPLKYRD